MKLACLPAACRVFSLSWPVTGADCCRVSERIHRVFFTTAHGRSGLVRVGTLPQKRHRSPEQKLVAPEVVQLK